MRSTTLLSSTKPSTFLQLLPLLLASTLAGCELVGDVIKASIWVVFVGGVALVAMGYGVFRIFKK